MPSKATTTIAGIRDTPSGETRRDQVLEAAIKVFFRKGYDGASLQDIAAETGILKGSLYYYYESKTDILFDVIKRLHDEHLDNARALVAHDQAPVDRLRSLLVGHTQFVCRNRERSSVLVREMQRLPAERLALVLGPDRDYQRVFRDAIARTRRAGLIAQGIDPKLATLWVLGTLSSLHRWYRPGGVHSLEQIADGLVDQLIRGIVGAAGRGDHSNPATLATPRLEIQKVKNG